MEQFATWAGDNLELNGGIADSSPTTVAPSTDNRTPKRQLRDFVMADIPEAGGQRQLQPGAS